MYSQDQVIRIRGGHGRSTEGRVLDKVVILAFLINPIDDKNAFVVVEPWFHNKVDCVYHVQKEYLGLRHKILQLTKAESLDRMVCIRERDLLNGLGMENT